MNESVDTKSLRLVLSKPLTSLHATTHRWQPTQRVVSIKIALLIDLTCRTPAVWHKKSERSAAPPLVHF
jgi:hypothetical protein